MKTTPTADRPLRQAAPRIVKKTRRDNAAYATFGGLRGEQDHDFLPQPAPSPQAPHLLEFGRPRL